VAEGLGLLPFGNAVHYQQRRDHFLRRMRSGDLPPTGYTTDVGAGLVYRNSELAEAIADRPQANAYRVTTGADGTVTESALDVRLIGPYLRPGDG
jgi:hypothetical protein